LQFGKVVAARKLLTSTIRDRRNFPGNDEDCSLVN
jgi:hypothetical protein